MEHEPVLLFDNKPIGSSPAYELLTISEAALFFRISKTSMRRLQERRAIPFIKVGGSVRFAKGDLIAYLQKSRIGPINQQTL